MPRKLKGILLAAAVLFVLGVVSGAIRVTRSVQSVPSITATGRSGEAPVTWASYAIVTAPASARGPRVLQREVARAIAESFSKRAMVYRSEGAGGGAMATPPSVRVYDDMAQALAAHPDSIVALKAARWRYSAFPLSRSYEGEVRVQVGPHARPGGEPQTLGTGDTLSLNITLLAQGQMAGLFTPRYLTANVAEAMAKTVTDAVDKEVHEAFQKATQLKAPRTD